MTAAPAPEQGICAGLLLAAGAGRRLGTPKALLLGPDGRARVQVVVEQLHRAGCSSVHVVVGAASSEVAALLSGPSADASPRGGSGPSGAVIVTAPDWAEGLGASLRAGLRSLEPTPAAAALVMLVDLPGVEESAMRRVLARATGSGDRAGALRRALVRAHWRGVPGHPVLLGREHWPAVLDAAHGDRGARTLLAGPDTTGVECSDLGDGRDVDTPQHARRAGLHPPSTPAKEKD